MRTFLLLAILATALVAADTGPDLTVARAAFGSGAPQRAALFESLGLRDDGRLRVAAGVATVGENLTIAAVDLASGNAIAEVVDNKQSREAYPITMTDGRTAAARVVRPSIGAAVIVIVAINDPAKPKATP